MSRLLVLGLLVLATVFVADLLLPLGLAMGTLYALAMLVALWLPGTSQALILATVASALTVAGAVLMPSTGQPWTVAANHGLGLVLIWIATLLVLRHRQTLDSLQRTQRTAETVLSTAGVAIVALDALGQVTLVNRKGCELLRAPESEIVGSNWFDRWLPEDERTGSERAFRALMQRQDGKGVEDHLSRVRASDGVEHLIAWRDSALTDEQGQPVGLLAAGEDVTGRMATERALGASRRELLEFKYALDQSSIVAITDAAGRITYANDMFCRISKYPREELLGQDHRLLNSGYHPKAFMRELWETIRAGRVWKGEIRNLAKDGTVYWVDTTIVPFVGEHGRPYQYLAIRSDITQRKAADQALQEQGALVRLGEMAAVVAHEVKNPLAGIAGALTVIRSRLPPESADPAVLDEILDRIAALNATVQDLLIFARPRALTVSPVRLLPLLAGMAEMMQRDPSAADVSVELPTDDIVLQADAEQLRQVLLNVLLNAVQAMGGSGTISIGAAALPDGRCRITVSDTGAGIVPDVLGRVFDPFVTTKHRGTGLGLAIARRVVEAHGGTISARCPEGGGTVMTIELPGESGASTAAGESPKPAR